MKKVNVLLGMFIICTLPFRGMALDLDNLELVVSSQLCQGKNCKMDCDAELTKRIGQDLPADADSCHAAEQYRLLAKGLYRTTQGEVKSLKTTFVSQTTQEKVDLPEIYAQQVSNNITPYIIDLQTSVSEPVQAPSAGQMSGAGGLIERSPKSPTLKASLQKEADSSPEHKCRNASTFGHRGDSSESDNSTPAELSDLREGHKGAEIDGQSLTDDICRDY